MIVQFRRGHLSWGWSFFLVATLILGSVSARPSAAAAARPTVLAEMQPVLPLWHAGADTLVSTPVPRAQAGSILVAGATRACSAVRDVVLASSRAGTAASTLVRGGQRVMLRATGLPPRTAFRLLLDVPRARLSGNLAVPVPYSPPAVAARSDGSGRLTDLQGTAPVRIALPDDTVAGRATVSLLRQSGSTVLPVQQVLRVWRFPVAPRLPAVQVQALDARGAPVAHATVSYRGLGASGAPVLCTGQADARGDLLLSGLPAGPATVTVQRGGSDLAIYHPLAVAGEVTLLRPAAGKPRPPLTTTLTTHVYPFCATATGYAYQILDSASGTAGARSGGGPFGVFLAGISTPDTFTAQITRTGAGGALLPIDHTTPVAFSIQTATNATFALSATIGADVPGAGTQDAPGYTNVTTQFDAVHLPTGTNWLVVEVGTGTRSCETASQIIVAPDPADTPLGTLDTYFDPASNSYQITGVLPTRPRLSFNAPIDLSLPGQSPGGVQLPPAIFQNWDNEGEVGLEVNETVHTDGSWSGTLTGHARLILLNHTLFDEQLPTLSGGGPNLASGAMSTTIPIASKSIDVSLFNYVIAVPFLGIFVVINVRLRATGSIDAVVSVPGMLNEADFTIDPRITFHIIGSATIPTLLGSISGAISGNLALAAPITLRVPGSPQWRVGIEASISVSYNVPGASGSANLLSPQCIGDCGPAGRTLGTMILRALSSGSRLAAASESQGRSNGGFVAAGTARPMLAPATPWPATPALDPQPATALSPAGLPATLWVARGGDGMPALRAQVGNGQFATLTTNGVTPATPQIAWIGPRRALAVWVASAAAPMLLDRVQHVAAGARSTQPRALLAREQLFSATWDGRRWSTPVKLTRGDALNAEPSLAADPATGRATLLWVYGPSAPESAGSLDGLGLATATYAAGQWSPAHIVPGTIGLGVNAPDVALDAHGTPAAAWLQGPVGMGRPVLARMTARGWSTPVAIAGLPDAAQRLSLAFDGAGRPLVAAEESGTISVARREPSGSWRAWNLGPGVSPRLARGAESTMLLVAAWPIATTVAQPGYQPALATLTAAGWSSFAPLALAPAAIADPALAADARTGNARVVATSDPAAQGSDAAPAGRLPAGRAQALDPAAGLAAVALSPGGAGTLVPQDVTLSDAHPRPGERVTVHVTVRNLGTTPAVAGLPVRIIIAFPGGGGKVTLRTGQAVSPGATTTIQTSLIAPPTALTVTASTAGRHTLRAILALPSAPRQVLVTPGAGNGGTLVQWTPAPDHDVIGYRIYHVAGQGAPVLAGLAHDTTWLDTEATAPATGYLVTAVDARGRESVPASGSL